MSLIPNEVSALLTRLTEATERHADATEAVLIAIDRANQLAEAALIGEHGIEGTARLMSVTIAGSLAEAEA